MKRFVAVLLLLTMNMSIASAAKVKVMEVDYNELQQDFTVISEVSKTCNSKLSFRVRGCTDFVLPYTCFVDVNAEGGEECDQNSMAIGQVSLEEMNLLRREMSGGTIVFQNDKGKTRKSIKLTNIR